MNLRFILSAMTIFTCGCAINEISTESTCLTPPQYKTTNTFKSIEKSALNLSKKYGPENVLLVFDADNTLVVMDQELGSDPWFNWQFNLLVNRSSGDELFFNNIQELLNAQRLLYDVSSMSPVEDIQPSILENLQNKGLRKIILTSRGPEMRSSTERELENNGFFPDSTDLTEKLYKVFYPYNVNTISSRGMTFNDLKKYRFLLNDPQCMKDKSTKKNCILPPKRASFQNNLYMTSGQHKGFMLEYFLKYSGHIDGQSFKAILFVDDALKNVRDIHDSFCNSGSELHLFHYTHEEPSVENFNNSDKNIIREKWNQLKKSIIPLQF